MANVEIVEMAVRAEIEGAVITAALPQSAETA
jgi:hypothetical protein